MIEVKNRSKRFRLRKKTDTSARRDARADDGWFNAVRDVSFHCAPGEVLGLLGPNGAGKTTALRLLATALRPDHGTARINGVDIVEQPMQVRRQIGFLSGTPGLYARLTARVNVEYFGRLHGMDDIRRLRRRHQRQEGCLMWIVCQKELRSLLRDRKTLIFTILIPIFAMPLLGFGFARVASVMTEKAHAQIKYAVFGARHAPAVAELFAREPRFRAVKLAGPE